MIKPVLYCQMRKEIQEVKINPSCNNCPINACLNKIIIQSPDVLSFNELSFEKVEELAEIVVVMRKQLLETGEITFLTLSLKKLEVLLNMLNYMIEIHNGDE